MEFQTPWVMCEINHVALMLDTSLISLLIWIKIDVCQTPHINMASPVLVHDCDWALRVAQLSNELIKYPKTENIYICINYTIYYKLMQQKVTGVWHSKNEIVTF